MASYPNFYETVAEATMRLKGTVVLYDGSPHTVLAITDHKGDGIFRIYLEPLGAGRHKLVSQSQIIPAVNNFPPEHPEMGPAFDKWLVDYTKNTGKPCPIIRKKMNSPLFNKFRPFPLGLCNYKGKVLYFERTPQRRTEQGLNTGALAVQHVGFSKEGVTFDFFGPEFVQCVVGDFPAAAEALQALADPDCQNVGLAFHRLFAFVRGPADTLFLSHKTDVIGFLPDNDSSRVLVSKKFAHLKEAVTETGVFSVTTIR